MTGELNAVDPDGDPVNLSVAEAPKYGSVVINRDGTFTYTPNPEFARTGGTDEFTVMAASTGFHLFGPGGVFAPGFGYTTLVKATVHLVAIKKTIDVGDAPVGVAVSPDGTTVYVVHRDFSGTVLVIDTGTNTVIDTITVGDGPNDLNSVAVTPDGSFAYVTNFYDDTVVVIDTGTNTVIDTITVGDNPREVAVSPDGTRAYVTNYVDGTVSVIDTAANAVIDTITVGDYPMGVAVSPDGATVYVTRADNPVVVIDTTTNTVIDTCLRRQLSARGRGQPRRLCRLRRPELRPLRQSVGDRHRHQQRHRHHHRRLEPDRGGGQSRRHQGRRHQRKPTGRCR